MQPFTKVTELYLASYRATPHYERFLNMLIEETDALPGSQMAPLKSIYRTMEKTAFRTDGQQWNANNVLDVLRGCILFDTMEGFIRCINVISQRTDIVIHRIKDRFSSPTAGGWRDCLINFSFTRTVDPVICELQMIHKTLMLARKGMAGHNDYMTYRSAIELKEFVTASMMIQEMTRATVTSHKEVVTLR